MCSIPRSLCYLLLATLPVFSSCQKNALTEPDKAMSPTSQQTLNAIAQNGTDEEWLSFVINQNQGGTLPITAFDELNPIGLVSKPIDWEVARHSVNWWIINSHETFTLTTIQPPVGYKAKITEITHNGSEITTPAPHLPIPVSWTESSKIPYIGTAGTAGGMRIIGNLSIGGLNSRAIDNAVVYGVERR